MLEIELFSHLTVCRQMTDVWIVRDTKQYMEPFNWMKTNE